MRDEIAARPLGARNDGWVGAWRLVAGDCHAVDLEGGGDDAVAEGEIVADHQG